MIPLSFPSTRLPETDPNYAKLSTMFPHTSYKGIVSMEPEAMSRIMKKLLYVAGVGMAFAIGHSMSPINPAIGSLSEAESACQSLPSYYQLECGMAVYVPPASEDALMMLYEECLKGGSSTFLRPQSDLIVCFDGDVPIERQ